MAGILVFVEQRDGESRKASQPAVSEAKRPTGAGGGGPARLPVHGGALHRPRSGHVAREVRRLATHDSTPVACAGTRAEHTRPLLRETGCVLPNFASLTAAATRYLLSLRIVVRVDFASDADHNPQ